MQADGATYQLLEAFTEPLAELGRYGEYLLQELKWDTSRNFSSTKHMARLVGKKLDRKHSAVGSIIVSHSDLEGVARYSFLGVDNFAVDSESNYDNLYLDETLKDVVYSRALVPWTSHKVYSVPLGAVFNTTSGVPFVCAESKSIKTCSVKWSIAKSNSASLLSFRAADGWNSYKYLTVPVVQGIQKTVVLGYSDGTAAQNFLLATLDVEAADNYYTRQFCYVEVEDTAGNVTRWSEIQHLQLANTTDRFFELEILDDLSGTVVRFGDSINGAIPANGAKITFHYLETLGAEGNVTKLYDFQNEISGAQLPAESEYKNLSIGCQNMWPIIGGKNLESLAEFKSNAERAYAKNYEILHTYSELVDAINSISPVPLIKVRTSTFYESSQINSTKVLLSKIGITGLSTAMQPLSSLEANLLEAVLNAELNKKVLSNKFIKYIAPKIVEIDSNVSVETKNTVQAKKDFSENLQEYLVANYGKANAEVINCYRQADLLRAALQHRPEISSIQATNLLTINATDVSFGSLGTNPEYYILFSFNLPKLNMDTTSIEGFCNKSLADGNEVVFAFNVNINGNNTTFVVKETKYADNDKKLFELADYFSETKTIYLYENKNTELSKYVIKPLLSEKYTFSKKELQSLSNLDVAATEPFASALDEKGVFFCSSSSKDSLTVYLALNAQKVAEYLGFTSTVSEQNIINVYNGMLSSIDSNNSRISLSFEPADETVYSDWDTIMYYNNINVTVEDMNS